MLLVMISGIASKTAIQKSAPIEKLGRVLSVKESLSIAAVPLGQMLFGVMIDAVSLPSTIGIFALILLLSGVLSFGFHRNLRSKSVC
jgi:predicted MFS family arabinose efflux permease